jgi:hypothetical protein
MTPAPRQQLPPLPFLVSDALAAGIALGRLRSRSLYAPVPGVRMSAEHRGDLAAVCRAVALRLPDGAAFSHVTAARLWGLPTTRATERDERLHITGPGKARPFRSSRVAAHVGIRGDDVRLREGIPVTSPVRTWLDLGALLTSDHLDPRGAARRGIDPLHEELVVVTDALLAQDGLRNVPRYGVRTEDLERALGASAGGRGVERLRRALDDARTFVDSPPETRVRLGLVAAGFPSPVVGADLFTTDGAWVGRPDLCWPQVGVAIDYDGAPHVSRRKLARDVARRDALERVGWRHVVLFADDVTVRWGITLRRVAEAFEAQGCREPGRLPPAGRTEGRPRFVVREKWRA